MYSEFDSDIVIRSNNGKTFNQNQINLIQLSKLEGVDLVSKAIEEVVVLKNEKKWVNSKLLGVEGNFLKMTSMNNHVVDGYPTLIENNKENSIIGISLLENLGGYLSSTNQQSLLFYAPKRDAKVRVGVNPFNTKRLNVSASVNYNKEINSEYVIVPLNFAKDILEYKNDITSIFIKVKDKYDNNQVKENIQNFLGKDFNVKTNYEKNELIYKTSKTEKLIVMFILLFIFILAAFNLVASITMLFVEKMDNISTLISFGANQRLIFRIFFYEGLLISIKGIISGLILGYMICFIQIYGKLLQMPNTGGDPFPINVSILDTILILILVLILSVLASFLPVKYLLKRNFDNQVF